MSQAFTARKLLAPLTPVYRLGLALREARLKTGLEPIRRLRNPVISIGNLSTGGTGKTPLTIALAQALQQRGFHIDVLSRGYGRANRNAARVDPRGTAEEYGDEPLLIAQQSGVPVYVASKRYQAGQLAEAERDASDANTSTIHLLDDGFQHRQLARAIDIVLLNRQDWRDRLLPSGNLREPLKAIRRANVLALPAEDATLESEIRNSGWAGAIWHVRRTMQIPKINGRILAFCGIARPDQFFAGLKTSGLELAACTFFPDHHRYTTHDLLRLTSKARASEAAALLTTEKDMVRFGNLANLLPGNLPIHAVALRIEIANQDERIDDLLSHLNAMP